MARIVRDYIGLLSCFFVLFENNFACVYLSGVVKNACGNKYKPPKIGKMNPQTLKNIRYGKQCIFTSCTPW